VLLIAKGLARNAFDAIAVIGAAHVFFRYDESNASDALIVRPGENQKIGMGRSNRCVSEYSRKQRLL